MIKVLLVDDDKNVKKFLDLKLSSKLVVDQALDSKQAMQKIEEEVYDFVIMDHRLPDTHGIDLVKKLGDKVKFIYSTFYLTESLKNQVLELGGLFIDKNELLTSPEILVSLIKSWGYIF